MSVRPSSISLFILLFSFISVLVSAQTMRRDVVYLKNASIVKGKVIKMLSGEEISIMTADGNVFVFQMNEVLKVAKESYSRSIERGKM